MTKIIVLLTMLLLASQSVAQTDRERLYHEAKRHNHKKEFSSAAQLFKQVQEEALKAGDIEHYILSITAEGECYYMLDLTTDMEAVIQKAKSAYNLYNDKLNKKTRWLLLESICKLEGSYYYCLSASDATAYSKAQDAYMKCLDMLDTIKYQCDLSFDDKELEMTIHRELTSLHYKQKLYDKALEEADKVYLYRRDIGFDTKDTSIDGIREYDLFVDAYVSRAMILARLNRFEEAIELLEEMPDRCGQESSVLRTKGKIQMLQYAFDGTGNQALAKRHYAAYIDKFKKEFSKQIPTLTDTQREQYWLAIHDFLSDCYNLEGYAADFLYDLALYSKGYMLTFRTNKQTSDYQWKDIRNKLKADECAIEFVCYKNHLEEKQMAALLIRNNSDRPHFIHIGPEKEIISFKLRNRESVKTAITNDNYKSKDILYADSTLFKKIWTKEIIDLIGDCNHVYFSPDGVLHQLAIEYMYPKPSVNCYRLSSTRVLLNSKKTKMDNILLCGGIEFYADVKPERDQNDLIGYNLFNERSMYISNLKGTEAEVDTIYNYRNGITNKNNILLKGEHATDEDFCLFAQRGFSIIHIATHGFFLGQNNYTDLKPMYRDHSMSESGLMLAGVGQNLNNKAFNPQYSDGILTAKELAELDLSDVRLIVLSACQTGLGQITADGVYGIQRAIKIAGADAMIVSLWSVDDDATMEFMKTFYKELNNSASDKRNIHRSFKKAREHIISKGKVALNRFNSQSLTQKTIYKKINLPRYTNAFILIDAI